MSSQELDNLLAALRTENRGVEAPERVEQALRIAFRAQACRPARNGWRGWALAAAAAVTVVIGAAVWKLGQPLPPQPAVKAAVVPPAPVLQPAPIARLEHPPAVKRVKPPVGPRVAPVAPEPVQEVATEFLPLEDTTSLVPIESGHVLRVALPRSAMVRFGFPVNQDRMMEPVKADVVFAQDGIARAIRFVK